MKIENYANLTFKYWNVFNSTVAFQLLGTNPLAATSLFSSIEVLFYMEKIDKQLKFYDFWRTKIINFIKRTFLKS